MKQLSKECLDALREGKAKVTMTPYLNPYTKEVESVVLRIDGESYSQCDSFPTALDSLQNLYKSLQQ